jgi:hypothetical protein
LISRNILLNKLQVFKLDPFTTEAEAAAAAADAAAAAQDSLCNFALALEL